MKCHDCLKQPYCKYAHYFSDVGCDEFKGRETLEVHLLGKEWDMTNKEAFEKILKIASSNSSAIQNAEVEIKTIYGYPIDNIRNALETLDFLKEIFGNYIKVVKDDCIQTDYGLKVESLPIEKVKLVKDWLEKEDY